MKRLITLIGALMIVLGVFSVANADPVNLYLDSTPNDGTRPAFFDATRAAIYNGTMVNQAHSFNPADVGTLKYEAEDYMVYSFGNGGTRLHAYYYVPNETVASLNGRFQVSILYNDAGVWKNPYQEYGWGEWVTPGSWVNYDGNNDGTTDGVMGSMGNAFWGAYEPIAYTVDSPEARAALANDLQYARDYLGNTQFMARLDGVTYTLTAEHTPNVPLPSTVILLGSGLAGLAFYRRRWALGRKG
jgi:hypothetical protein